MDVKLVCAILAMMVASSCAEMVLNGNTFFITNKAYPHANLVVFSNNKLRTYEEGIYSDQLWELKEHPDKKGFYYVENVLRKGYRLAKWGAGNRAMGVFKGHKYNDQLWKFVKEGNYYRIYNHSYSNAKLTKFGKKNHDLGTYEGWNYDDQLWKLTPRFQAELKRTTKWQLDNLQGSYPVSNKVTITEGLVHRSSSSFSTTNGLTLALEASVGFEDFSSSVKTEFSMLIARTTTTGSEKSWSKTVEITFTAPAHKFYRVSQLSMDFDSPYDRDDCTIYGSYKIEESDHDMSEPVWLDVA